MDKVYSYEEIEEIANYLSGKVSVTPHIGIICGSGLGFLGDTITKPTILDYKDIPNFPISTLIGHPGRLIFGHISETPVVCMQGRFHFYEGNSLSTCVMPVRLMKLLGVETLIVSNAAGGVNPSYKVGDIMLIKDHINFVGIAGISPLRGSNEEKFGPRFLAMNDAYTPQFIKEAKALSKDLGLKEFWEGVYGCVGGPIFETVAEVKFMRCLGVDAVGMSTVHEVITARHCDMKCFAFSVITNECVGSYTTDEKPDSHEILAAAKKRENELRIFIERFVTRLSKCYNAEE